jgi:hypothetical protein
MAQNAVGKPLAQKRLLNIPYRLLDGVPVPTAWRVLGQGMEERPPAMEVSCEYIE